MPTSCLLKSAMLLLLPLWLWVAPADADGPRVEGVWVYLEGWHEPPAEVPGAAPWSPALIANFCPGGEFVLASGAMYKGRSDMALGADDGLRIYRGVWKESEAGIEVRYRLVDYEIQPAGDPELLKKEATGLARRDGEDLIIPVVVFDKELRYKSMTFVDASRISPPVVPRFAKCDPDGQAHASAPDNSLQRTGGQSPPAAERMIF